jgi:putative tryptophan/tyrosine transport system substrate-binding protein
MFPEYGMTIGLRTYRSGTVAREPFDGRTARRALFTCLTVLMALSSAARTVEGAAAAVGVVYGSQASYRDAVTALQKSLESRKYRCILIELPKAGEKGGEKEVLARLEEAKPRVLVGVGNPAMSLIRQSKLKVPVVFCMVPNALDASFLDETDKTRVPPAGVTTDIDPAEQIGWIRKLCPDIRSIGILYSTHTGKTSASIQRAGKAAGIEIIPVETERDRVSGSFKELSQRDCDAVLMLPDAGVYNSTNVRALLLWGMRQKKPVFGFSESVVKAGGFAGQYCKIADVGKQTGELVERILKGEKTGKIGLQYAKGIQRGVNVRTAEMIGKPLDATVPDQTIMRFGSDK